MPIVAIVTVFIEAEVDHSRRIQSIETKTSMACILKGFSAMLRALRRNKNRIVPAKSKTVDKIIEDTSNNSSQTKEKVEVNKN